MVAAMVSGRPAYRSGANQTRAARIGKSTGGHALRLTLFDPVRIIPNRASAGDGRHAGRAQIASVNAVCAPFWAERKSTARPKHRRVIALKRQLNQLIGKRRD